MHWRRSRIREKYERTHIYIAHRICHWLHPLPLDMYRLAIARLTRPAAKSYIQTTAVAHRTHIRFKSYTSEIEKEKKARLERFDDLQRDWDARILTYEELKLKTQQPTPVRQGHVGLFHGDVDASVRILSSLTSASQTKSSKG